MQLATFVCLIFILVLPSLWVSGYHYENITGAIVGTKPNPRPCMRANNNSGYNDFRCKHILSDRFDTNEKQSWREYLMSQNLCGRVPIQSFLQESDEAKVKRICRDDGKNVNGNLCISEQTFLVYAIWSMKLPGKECEIICTHQSQQPVVVACDAIDNQCLPVHYEAYRGQVAGPNAQVCR